MGPMKKLLAALFAAWMLLLPMLAGAEEVGTSAKAGRG